MPRTLQDGDFPKRRDRKALLGQMVDELLERHCAACARVTGLLHHAKRSLADFAHDFVAGQSVHVSEAGKRLEFSRGSVGVERGRNVAFAANVVPIVVVCSVGHGFLS